jgi:hypothetical protein
MAVIGSVPASYNACANVTGSTSPLDLTKLPTGTEICVTTNNGHYAAPRLDSLALASSTTIQSAGFYIIVWQLF